MCKTHSDTADSEKRCGGTCSGSCPGAIARAAAKNKAHQSHPTVSQETSPSPSFEHFREPSHSPVSLQTPKRSTPSLEHVTTFGADGKRVVLYPAKAQGIFTQSRALLGVFLLTLYLALPWIPFLGAPAIFLNIADRRFHLFGLTFFAQDLWLAFFVISGLGFALFLLTALLGRVWCGWACPLTVLLDLVRRIENWIEGDPLQRKRAHLQDSDSGRSFRAFLKHLALALIAALMAHGFLAYFVSIPSLLRMMQEAPSKHLGAFTLVAALTAALWFSFAWFREQFCIVLCPYGRLQSILTDEHTLVIGYDALRGEPRGKASASPTDPASPAKGDCVDCGRCVQVCPTGIDIRHGLQLECIGCAACVDACSTVMQKLARPTGLIRYDSLAGLQRKPKRLWRPRFALYGVLLLFGLAAASFAISTLHSAAVSFTRMPGTSFFVQDGVLRNQFLLRIFNKQPHENWYHLSLLGDVPEGIHLQSEAEKEVAGWGEGQMVVVITLPITQWHSVKPLTLVVQDSNGHPVAHKRFSLIGPDSLPAPKPLASVLPAPVAATP